jgi:hypothetical protein
MNFADCREESNLPMHNPRLERLERFMPLAEVT